MKLLENEAEKEANDGENKEGEKPELESLSEPKELELKCSAEADFAGFVCGEGEVVSFRPTMMFQTRAYKFPVKNTSAAPPRTLLVP